MDRGMQALPKGEMGACRSCVALAGGWSEYWLRSEGACGLSADGCECFQALGKLQPGATWVLEVETSWCYQCLA